MAPSSLRRGGRLARLAALLVVVALAAAACGSDDSGSSNGGGSGSSQVRIDGSSTVAPLSEAAAAGFQKANPGVQVTVGTSGTGGGFEKFCAGETDISNASREIEEDEIEACEAANVEYEQIQVANDGMSVVVNPANDWVTCLTVEQLETIWGPDADGKIERWNQVDPSFPDEALTLYGPGTDSGTFDYFTEAVNGEEGASRTDFNATEDDNVIVQGVSGDPGVLGYFGLSHLLENEGKVKGVEIDGGDGCVAPSDETVQDGTYVPLSRPLFIYVRKDLSQTGIDFVTYYIDNISDITRQALFVDLTPEQKTAAEEAVAELSGGTTAGAGDDTSPSPTG